MSIAIWYLFLQFKVCFGDEIIVGVAANVSSVDAGDLLSVSYKDVMCNRL